MLPTIVIHGAKSPEPMRRGSADVAKAIPGAKLRSLEGMSHMIKPKLVVPVLEEFFGDK